MKPEPKDNLAVLLYAAYASWVTESNILLTIEQAENKEIGKYLFHKFRDALKKV